MNGNQIVLVTKTSNGKAEFVSANQHQKVKVAVKNNYKYLLKNPNNDFAPENIILKRVGNDLEIIQAGDEEASFILLGYFDEQSEHPPLLMGIAEDGQLYHYIPLSDEGYETGYLLADAQLSPVALGGQPLGSGEYYLLSQESDSDLYPLLGFLGTVGAIVAGAAIANHNDKDNDKKEVEIVPPVSQGIGKILDNTGDKTGLLKDGDITDETHPQLSGKGQPGNTIHIIDNGKVIGETTVDRNGNWSWTPDKALSDGEHVLTTTEKDSAGNTSPPSSGVNIVVDSTPPATPAVPVTNDNVGDNQGPLADGDSTDDTQPELSGTGEPGNTINIIDNGEIIGSATVGDDGNWSWTPDEPLAEGEHELATSETDPAGNTSEPSPGITIEVDTTPPKGSDKPPVAIDNVGDNQGPLADGDSTDDTQPELSGTGEPGNTINIIDNGEIIGSATVGDDGNWSWTPDKPLAEGEHELATSETDPAGNTSEPSPGITIEVDTTPPKGSDKPPVAIDNVGDNQGPLADGDSTDDTQPELSGTGEPGNTINIIDNGEIIGSATIGDDGSWSWTPDEPLAEGEHELATSETDQAGNTGEPSPGVNIVVDTTPPKGSDKPPVAIDNVGDNQGPLADGDSTDDTQPELSGTGEPGNTINIIDNGEIIGSVTVGDDGSWSWTPDEPLAEGEHELATSETDPAGNTGEPSPGITIEVDTTPPKGSDKPPVAIDNVGDNQGPLADGDSTDDTQPELSGTGEPGNTINIIDNGEIIGSATVGDDGNWSWTPDEPLAEGEHELATSETDPAGNTGEPSPGVNIVVDTTPPKGSDKPPVAIDNVGDNQGPLADGDSTDDTQPELSGTGEPGNTINIIDNGEIIGSATVGDDGSWSWTPDEPLAEGEHELATSETDPAGNTSEPSPGVNIVVDTTPPKGSDKPPVAIDNVGDNQGPLADGDSTDDTQPELSGTGEPGNTINIIDNGEIIGSATVGDDGSWSWTPDEPLTEGEHELATSETDPAGNTSEPSPGITIEVDTTPPSSDALAITGVQDDVGEITGNIAAGGKTDDSRPAISGTGTAGDTLILYVTDASGKHEIGRTTVDSEGNWSLQLETPLLAGNNVFSAVEVDAAGNSTTSTDYPITLYVTGPDAPSIGAVIDNEGSITGPLQKGDVTDDNTPTLSGSTGAGDTVRIYDNGQLVGSTVADDQGNWTYTLEKPLTDGEHNLSVTATNDIGQTSKPSGDFNLVVDTQAPGAATDLTVTDNEGAVQGVITPGNITDDATPTLNGSAEPGSVVNIYDNGEKIGEANVDENGSWTWTPDSALSDGDHSLTTTVTDAAGNESVPSPEITLTVDTTEPTAQITQLVDDQGSVQGNVVPNGVTDDSRPEIKGIAKANSKIVIYDGDTVLGSTTSDADGNWSFTPEVSLVDGQYSLSVTATDAAGNTSQKSGEFIFDIDTQSPGVPTIGGATDDVGAVRDPLVNGSVTDDSTPTLMGTAEANSVVTIYDNGNVLGSVTADENGTWSYTPTTSLNEGEHRFTVTATDAAGNVSRESDQFTLNTDYTAADPARLAITGFEDDEGEIQGNIVSGGNTDDMTPVISGTGTAGDTIVVYTSVSGVQRELGRAEVKADGTWSLALDNSNALTGGVNHITAVEIDPAGNSTSPTPAYVVTVYTPGDGPVAASINGVTDDAGSVTGPLQKGDVTDDTTPTLNGTAGAGQTVRIYDNGEEIGRTTADGNGNWTYTTPALKDGNHIFTADAVNSVGQVSEKSGGWEIMVDATAPDAVKDLVITDNVGAVQGPVKDGDTTDDNTPTLSGSAEPGSVVNIWDGNKKVDEVAVDENGKWSWTPDMALDDGDHTLAVSITDPAGNESERTPGVTITVDTSPSTVAITNLVDDQGSVTGNIAANGVTDDIQPEIKGTGKAGSTVSIYDGDTLLGTTTVAANGTWSFTPSTALSEGSHTIWVNATDTAGNTSEDVSFTFTVDTSAPEQPTITGAYDDVGLIQGELENGGVTDDSTPTLSGTAEANSLVTIYDGNSAIGSVKAGADGTWSWTPTSTLGEGEHRFTVTATDSAGNVSGKSGEFVLTTDYTGPDASKLAITGVADDVGEIQGNVASGGSTDDTKPVISGTGTAGDTIEVYTTLNGTKILLGTAVVDKDGKWNLALDDSNKLASGSHGLTAVEIDPAGNATSPTPAYTVTVVTDVPAAPAINSVLDDVGVTHALQKGEVTDDSTPTLNGTAGAGLTVRIYDNGTLIGSTTAGKNGNWSFTPTPALEDGNHVFTADALDSVGQSSVKSGEWNIVVDTAAPDAVKDLVIGDNVGMVQGPVKDGDTTDDSTPTLSGSAEPGSTVTVWDNGQKAGEVAVDEDGKWSWTPDAALSDGDHSLAVSVTDPAGNESARTPEVSITVDSSGVDVAITNLVDDQGSVTGNIAANGVTDDTQPEINGIGKAGSTVSVYDGDTLLGTTTVKADGTWSFTPSTALGEGSHTIKVNATDLAGNTSEDVSFAFTVDTSAPVQPTITGAFDDVGKIQGELANGGVTDDPTPTLSGKAEAGSLVTIYDGNSAIGSVKAGADGTWSWTSPSTLSEGEHRFTVTATDAAGNVSGKSDEFVLTTDYTGPDANKLAITGFEDNEGETTGNIISGGATDDTTPVISGTGTAGDTIEVFTTLNGTKILLGTAVVDKDGNWSLALDDSNKLASGTHNLTAVETDPAGNSTSPTPVYVVTVYTPADAPAAPTITEVSDDAGSVTGPLQKGEVTDDTTPTLNGTAGAGMTVRIYDNGTLIGSTAADSNGSWSFTPSTALEDGNHVFTVVAVNGVGQNSESSNQWNVVVDTAAPDAVKDLEINDNVGAVQGPVKDGDTTDDSTPTLNGSAEPGSTVTVWDNGQKAGEVAVDEDGKWSWTPDAALPDGDHSLAVSVTDPAGNESARTPEVSITVDSSGVDVAITNLVDDQGSVTGNIAANGVTDDARPEINGTGKAGSIVSIYDGETLLGTATVAANGTWSFTPTTNLSEGSHTIKVNATDTAGNTSEDVSFTFTVDTSAPVQPTIAGAYDDVGKIQGELVSGDASDDPTPTLNGTAEAGSLVTIYDGNNAIGSVKAGADGTWSWTPTSTLGEGEHRFTVTATDTAGNVSGKSDEFVLTTDYTGPDASKLAITGVADDVGEIQGNVVSGGNTDDAKPVISGTGTAGDTIEVYTTLNGTKILLGTAVVDKDGKWSLALDDSNKLASGTHGLTAVESDPAGNSTSPTPAYTVTVVTDVPAAPAINSVLDDVGTTHTLQKGEVTDDSTPTLNGTAGAGLTVRIYDNGQYLGSTTADGNGNWSFTPSTALKDGNHVFTADALDGVGQSSVKSGEWSVVVDTTAPDAVGDLVITDNVGAVQGPVKDGDTTDDSTPTLNGSAEPGSTVTIWDNGQKKDTVTVGEDGKWSWTPDAALPDGDHSLAVSVTDPAGNESARTPEVTITVDSSGVDVAITSVVDDQGSVTGNIAANGVTDDARPEINGTGKAGSIVNIYDGDTLLGTTTVAANGTWSFTPSTALGDGSHTIKVNATDTAGNTSEDVSFTFTVDTSAPEQPTITGAFDDVGKFQGELANGGVTDDPTPTLNGTAEAGSLVTIYDGNSAIGSVKAGADGTWSWTPASTISEGEHRFTVTATDIAGNVSGKSGEFVLTTDYTGPDASKLAITGFEDDVGETQGNVANGGSTDDTKPVISGTGTAGDTIEVYTTLNGTKILLGTAVVDKDGKWSLALDDSNKLASGSHGLTAVETDPAGNSTSPTPAYTVTVVTDVPAAPAINSVLDDVGTTHTLQKGEVTDDSTPTLNGTAGAGLTVRIYDNGQYLGSTTADSNGNWSFTPSTALKDGSHVFTADALDGVGQSSVKSGEWSVVVDTTAPDAVGDLVITDNVGNVQGALNDGDTTDDSTPTLNGSAEPGSTVTVWDNGQKAGEVAVDEDGKWSWTPDAALPDGDHSLAVSVTDPAGNESARTPEVSITVDSSGVEVVITSVVDDQGSVTGNIAANGVTDDTQPEIKGSGKAGSTVNVYDGDTLLGTTTVAANGTWSFTPTTNLSEGSHTIKVNATDTAGNTSEDVSFTFTVDTTMPTRPAIDSVFDDVGKIQGELEYGGVTDDPTPTLNGTAEAGSLVTIYDGNSAIGSVKAGADGTWSWTPASTISEGEHRFTVTATDAAGNVSAKSGEFVLTTDYTGPDASKLAITGFEDDVGETQGNVANGGSTDDTKPVISGTGTAGDTIEVFTTLNGTKILLGTAVVDKDGNWSLALDDSNKLASGTHSLTAVETDPAGNSTSPSPVYTVTVVTDVPAAPAINSVLDDVGVTHTLQKGEVTDDSTPTLNGTAGAGVTVRIYDNDQYLGSTTADSNGNWSFTPSTALKDGSHVFTADALDGVGQSSVKSGEWSVVVDTTAPDAVKDLVITDNAGDVQGPLKDGDTTDDSTPTMSGKAEPGSTVTIWDNGQKAGEVAVDEDGKWSWTPDAALPDGDHSLAVSVTDPAGNESARTPEVSITVDSSGVDVAITSVVDDQGSVTGNIAANGVTDDAQPEIKGSGKAGSTVSVYDGDTLLGTTTVAANGTWSFTPKTALGEGSHTIKVNATDTAGNTSEDVSFTFTVDTSAPEQSTITGAFDDVGKIQGELANGGVTDDPTPTLSGKAEAGSLVTIYDANNVIGSVKAGADGTWSWTPTSTLGEGEHRFTVTATDAAGNVSGKSGEFVLTTDYTGPDASKLAITGVADDVGEVQGNVVSGGNTDDTKPVISGTGTAGDTIEVYTTLNGTKILLGTTIVDEDGNWSLALDDSNKLASGSHGLTAVETDPAGNSTSPTPAYTVTVVTDVPAAPAINSVLDDVGVTHTLQKGEVTDDSTPTLSGTAGAGLTVRIYDNGTLIGSTTADGNGNWSFTPSTALEDGNHVFTADALDSVGQSSVKSGEWNIVVDTAAPDAVGDLVIGDNVGTVQGPVKDGDTTDDNTPTLSGSAEPGSTVTVWDNGQKAGEVAVDEDGKWSWTPDAALPDGDHSLAVSVTDPAGNESARTPDVAITIDTSGSSVLITSVVDDQGSVTGNVAANGVTDDTQPEIKGTGKAGSIVNIYDGETLLGTTTVAANGTWSFTPTTNLGEGSHTIKVNATDTAGNTSEDVSFTFTVDTSAPQQPTIIGAYDDVGLIQGELANGGVTDDPTPTLNGTAEAGSLVTIYDGNSAIGSVKAGADGTWSWTPASTISEGEHRFTVTATDAAGNVSGKSGEFVLTTDFTVPDSTKLAITGVADDVGEVQGNVVSGGSTDDTKPVISGTGTAGDTIEVYTTLNGTKIHLGTAVVDKDGKWSLAVSDSNALAEGTHELTAVETDAAGNSTAPTPVYAITIVPLVFDAPTIERVEDNVGAIMGELENGAYTDDTTPTLSGKAIANSTVRIYDGEKLLGSVLADDQGVWVWTINPALAEGEHNFTATATSSVGQTSEASNSWSVIVDTTAPLPVANLTITDDVGEYQGQLVSGAITDDNKPTFSGSAEVGSTVAIYDGNTVLAKVIVDETGIWSWTPETALADGSYSFTSTVTDPAGNESTPTAAVNITVDTVAPTVELAIDGYYDDVGTNTGLLLNNGGTTDDTSPVLTGSWTGTLADTDTIRIYQDGVLVGTAVVDLNKRTWTYAVDGLLNTNTYHWTATAVDVAGNETVISPEFSLTVDLDAPTQTVTILSYTDDVGLDQGDFASGTTTDDRNPTLNGKINGAALDEGDVVRIYDVESNTLLGNATIDHATNTWTFILPPLTDDMSYSYRAVVADAAGNEGTKSSDFDIHVNLTININSQNTLDTTPIISGFTGFDIQEGEYLKVTVNGQTYSSENGQVVIDLRNNTWYVQIPDSDALAVGSYDVTAVLYAKNGTKITEDDSRNELVVGATPKITFTAAGATSDDTGTAITISEDGSWRILSNSAVFTQNGKDSTELGSFKSIVLNGIDRQQQSTFIDFDRDGRMDILGADTRYNNGQQSFKYDGNTYTVFQVGAYNVDGETNNANGNGYVWYGGAAGIDIDGDGFVDIIYGDETPNDAEARGGHDTTFVMNTNGTVAGFVKSGAYVYSNTSQNGVANTNSGNPTPDREIATVDLNNDGYVDIVYHGTSGTNTTSAGGSSGNSSRLAIVENNRDANGNVTLTNTQIITGVFNGNNAATNRYTTLTWADLNGDGYMDLFVGGLTGYSGTRGAESVIYYNDGTGKFVSESNGVGAGSSVQTMGDAVNSNTSLAVDWNNDGRMDLIEIGGESGSTAIGNANNIGLLWLNNGVNQSSGQVNWSSSTILNNANLSSTYITTGAVLVDLDYDGDQDLVVFRAEGGETKYIENTNTVTEGTSIIVRILDANGINAFYGNTVMLIDEATGEIVSSQIINAQGGVNMNNSTGLVYFYGLDETKSYSVVMLANGKDYGGVNSVTLSSGANTIENVNASWGGLKAVEANHAYVLTAESAANASNASTAATDSTNAVGIVGTGYNDTLFATAGTHIYNGGGGSVKISNVTSWSDTGGLDIVDYKLAGNTPLTIDLNKMGMQNTGFGSAQFVNIEGLAGGAGNDTFTGNAANNHFEGRGGDDHFILTSGGQDTLMYNVLANSNNGGNGRDTVDGFHVGTIEATPNADIIDISSMLVGYTPDADGAAHYINGKATLDAGDTITQYLSVSYSGNDTVLNIDRDGNGGAYGMTALVTLKDVHVDLETLLANHQITLS